MHKPSENLQPHENSFKELAKCRATVPRTFWNLYALAQSMHLYKTAVNVCVLILKIVKLTPHMPRALVGYFEPSRPIKEIVCKICNSEKKILTENVYEF